MKRLFPILLIAVLIGGFLAYRSGLLHFPIHLHMDSKKAIYYCPMHPTYTSDRPGSCPICNMTLVKREEADQTTSHAETSGEHQQAGQDQPKELTMKELMAMKPGEICLLHKCKMGQCLFAVTEEIAKTGKCPHCGEDLGIVIKQMMPEGYAKVAVSHEKQQAIGIETAPVKKIVIEKTIRTVGRIAYDPELYQAQEEYLQAIQALKKAENSVPEIKEQASKLVESAKIKLRLLGLSSDLVGEIETLGKPDRSLLYSDVGGRVWLYAPIYEYEIPLVKVGDTLEIEIPSVPDKKVQGIIRSIDSVLDPMTRSVRVRAVLENPEGLLKPEMYANATLKINLGENATVPTEAVFSTGEKNIVFVAKPDGVFEPREVTLGIKTENGYQVKSGLGEDELVVTSGNFLIDSESRLKAALQGMGSGGGHQHGG